MQTFSTCRTCGGSMTVTENPQYWHPTCTPSPTRLEAMLETYRQLAERGEPGDETALVEIEQKVDAMAAQPPRMLDAALQYAAWGWPVFPLIPFGQAHPRTGEVSDGKKPATRNGFKQATTDFEQIRKWWAYNPQLNIGIATGVGFDVIDVDPPAGAVSWMKICDSPKLPNCHGRVSTPSGGFHLYVEPTGSGNRTGIYPGIDYRGVGGYVVAPPSVERDRVHTWGWGVYPSPLIIPSRQKEAVGQ